MDRIVVCELQGALMLLQALDPSSRWSLAAFLAVGRQEGRCHEHFGSVHRSAAAAAASWAQQDRGTIRCALPKLQTAALGSVALAVLSMGAVGNTGGREAGRGGL